MKHRSKFIVPIVFGLSTSSAWDAAAAGLTSVQLTVGEHHVNIIAEAVNNYDNCGGTSATLTNSIPSATGFVNGMTGPGNAAGFVAKPVVEDGNVLQSHFYDPDLCPGCGYDDTDNFDAPGTAISFYQGHGGYVAKPSPWDQVCSSEAQCLAPPAGTEDALGLSGFGTCSQSPVSWAVYGPGFGVCQYKDPRGMILCPSTGQGTVYLNSLNGPISYVAFGETPYLGAWRGAGTNGGTSLVINHMSFGMLNWYPSEWWSVFAGAQLYASTIVSWGDANDDASFGPLLAQAYVANPHGSVSEAYSSIINDTAEIGGCNTSNGGFNGCGCFGIMTRTNATSAASSPLSSSWTQLTVDNREQIGANNWYIATGCNYDMTGVYQSQGGDGI